MAQVVLGFLFLLLNLPDLEVHEVQVLLVLQVGPTILEEIDLENLLEIEFLCHPIFSNRQQSVFL